MYNVLVLWAPDTAENRKLVDAAARALEQAKVTLVVKSAAEATIADVNGADIIVFGARSDPPPTCLSSSLNSSGYSRALLSPGRTAGSFRWDGKIHLPAAQGTERYGNQPAGR